MAIELTESAAKQISSYMATQAGAVGLRFGVKNSGCSGFAYTVDMTAEISDSDEVFESHGIKVIVDREHLQQVDGTQIDYESDGFASAFKFRNPKVVDECGCGESFSVDPS